MRYELAKVRELRGMGLQSDDPARVRDRILECLTTLGVDVAGAAAASPDGPPRTAVFWASDADFAVHVFSVPDHAITPAQRAALAATPFCFADAGDCSEVGWFGALRLIAAIGHGENGDELYTIGVADNELADYDGAPTREELEATWLAWDPHHAVTLTDKEDLSWLAARFSALHVFQRAM